jgi:glycosyltransferase involved in cell wall biosynthesis
LHVLEATIGGARRHVVDACRGLAGRGVRTTLVCAALREPAMRRDMQELAASGVEVRELPMLRAIRPHVDFGHLLALRRILRELEPDVVHTHSSKAGVLGRLASRSTGIGARVHTPHTFAFLFGAMFGSRSRAVFRAVEWALASSTDRFVAVSQDEAATFESAGFIPRAKVRVVPNGVDLERWSSATPLERSELGAPAAAPCVAVVGLLNIAKGQDLAIRALASRGLEELHLLVVGHGELRGNYEALAKTLGVSARTHFLGWRDDTPRILRAVDALLLPSRWEGMPYIVLEAMAASLPVVATRVDGARGVLEEARCGVLCDVGSVESIAEGLGRLLALDASGRAELAARGRAAVEARYTLDHMVDGLVAVYRELA